MPWTKRDVPKFKKGLSDSQKEQWVEVANSVLSSCRRRGGTDCEAEAIRKANAAVDTNNNNNMEKLKLYWQRTSGYRARTVTHQGKRHVVFPVTMMVEGVHSGSHGPLLHPAEELGRYPASWDGIPVVINHPQDSNGNAIHANHPDVIDSQVIGRVYNTHMDGNKLKAEVWLDEQATNRMDSRIIPRARANRRLDVSVGVFTDEEHVSGTYEGENYQRIARNHRPDHLAILPDDVGACSMEDGCGVNLNIKKGGKSVKQTETKEEYTPKLTVADWIGELVANQLQTNQRGYREIMESLQQQLDSMDDGERSHYLVDLFDDTFVYKVRYSGSAQPAYFKRGYTLNDDNTVSMDGDPVKVAREVEYVELNNNKKEGEAMTKRKKAANAAPQNNQNGCCEKVDELINNQSTQFTEDDREWLETLKEEQLEKLSPLSGGETTPQNNTSGGTATATDDDEPGTVNEVQISGEKLAQALKNHVQKPEDFINLAPKELQDSLRSGLNLHREQRKQMISAIQNNVAEGTFTEKELNEMSTDWLKKMYKSVVRADYSANAGDPSVQNNKGYKQDGVQMNSNSILPPPGVEVEDDVNK